MTGYWVLDDGKSLCYVESDNSPSLNSQVPLASAAANAHGLSSLESVLSVDANDCTTKEQYSLPFPHDLHTEFGSYSSTSHTLHPATQSGRVVEHEPTSTNDLDYLVDQPVLDNATSSTHLASPSSVWSGLKSNRKRPIEDSHGQPHDGNQIENRKMRPSKKQLILRPAVKIHVTDHCLLSPLANLNLIMGFNTRLPNSRFDGYIHALRQLIRCSAEKSTLGNNLKRALTAEGVLWVVRESWPAAEGYWNLTATFKGFLHAELWRNFPCERTYRQLPPEYRPTRAQLMVPHSPMIDWMPWPDLRDLAIRYQDEIDTDELFRMAILNVVAHRKKLVWSSPVTSSSLADRKSFRVWDLVCLEKSNGVNPLADPGLTRKPVLHSPSARALVRAFDLEYDEFATQKLDDRFFEAFPSLYCDTAASSWTVEAFPTILPEDVGYPVDLTGSAVHRLKSRFESIIGNVIEV